MGASLQSVVEQFTAMGMPPIAPQDIKVDAGRFIRYGPGKKAYYKLFGFTSSKTGKTYITGTFGHKGDGPWKVESDVDQVLSAEDMAALRKQRENLERAERERRELGARRAAGRAKAQIDGANRTGESDYLQRKLVANAEAVRFMHGDWDGWIIIPALRYDGEPRIVGSQKIGPAGEKRFNTGMAKEGASCRLGAAPVDGQLIVIAEGYATGASAREATAYLYPVFLAWDAGNLIHVARIIRQLYPASPVLFAADDDYMPKASGEPNHEGERKARAAATEIGNATVLLPAFTVPRSAHRDDVSAPKLTDFNDLHLAEGIDAVRSQMSAAIEVLAVVRDEMVADSPAPIPEPDDTQPDAEFVDGHFTIARLLQTFRPIYGTTEVWDEQNRERMKDRAFVALVGKELANEWKGHPDRRPPIKKAAVAAQQGRGGDAAMLLERFHFIAGSTRPEVWDVVRRCRLPLQALQAEYPNEFELWHRSPIRPKVEHNNIVFDPTGTVDLDTHINTFNGLPSTPVRGRADLCRPIIQLVYHLCNGDESIARWIMQWMAYPLQTNFKDKMGSALLFHSSVHGSGKSLLFEGILSQIYGEYAVTAGSPELQSQYNAWRSGKLFCLFEEVLTPKDKFEQSGNIKHMITGRKVIVNQKFVSAWEEANYMNTAFLSNELRPLPIEPYDRRMMVVWPKAKLYSEKMAPDTAELTYEVVRRCIDDGGIQAFHGYLLDFDLTGFDSHNPPMTQDKRNLIRLNYPSYQLFYEEWSKNLLPYAPFVSCLAQDLYAAYKRFCSEWGERQARLETVMAQLCLQEGVNRKSTWYLPNGTDDRVQRAVVTVGVRPEHVPSQEVWLGNCIAHFQDAMARSRPEKDHP